MKKIALLFAGQGAQSVGMGRDLAEQFPTAADLFGQADEILGRNLSQIAWNGPIEELKLPACTFRSRARVLVGPARTGRRFSDWRRGRIVVRGDDRSCGGRHF